MGRLEDLKLFKAEIEELLKKYVEFEERWAGKYDLPIFVEDVSFIRLKISKLIGDVEVIIRFCEKI